MNELQALSVRVGQSERAADRRITGLLDDLSTVSKQLADLRIQRDNLIRQHPGTLREIGQAAGLSPQAVLNIKNRSET